VASTIHAESVCSQSSKQRRGGAGRSRNPEHATGAWKPVEYVLSDTGPRESRCHAPLVGIGPQMGVRSNPAWQTQRGGVERSAEGRCQERGGRALGRSLPDRRTVCVLTGGSVPARSKHRGTAVAYRRRLSKIFHASGSRRCQSLELFDQGFGRSLQIGRMDALGTLQLRKDGTILFWAKDTASQHQRSTGHPSEDSDPGHFRPSLWLLSTGLLCIWWRLRRRKARTSRARQEISLSSVTYEIFEELEWSAIDLHC